MDKLTRRAWMEMATASTVGAAAIGAVGEAKAADAPEAASTRDSLHALAVAKGMTGFGSCIGDASSPPYPHEHASPFADEGFRNIFIRECGILVPSSELKWTVLRPNPRDFNFYRADVLVNWAEQHDMKIRGHNLMWPRRARNPEWLDNYDFGSRPATEAERVLRYHITAVCQRYGTRIFTYDVVNEAVNPRTGKLRDEMVFGKYLGDAMMDIAFDAAHKAAPHAKLVYNDFVKWSADDAKQREGVLELLSRLKSSDVPVDVLGVESHIGTVGAGNNDNVMGTQTFDTREQADWKSFLDSVVAMGYRLAITEFDVSEIGTPADIPTRDRGMADLTRRYLDAMLSYPQVEYVMCWGMVDHHSWLQSRAHRHNGMMKRPCPYDDNYQPKLIRQAIADALRAAPARG